MRFTQHVVLQQVTQCHDCGLGGALGWAMNVTSLRRSRSGFTAIEIVIVLVIAGIVMTFAIRSSGETLRRDRVAKVATIVGADLEQAFSIAARQRSPVRVRFDSVRRTFSISERADTTFKFKQRALSSGDLAVDFLSASPSSFDIMPTGLATSTLRLSLGVTTNDSTFRRTINMTRAGLVRLVANP